MKTTPIVLLVSLALAGCVVRTGDGAVANPPVFGPSNGARGPRTNYRPPPAAAQARPAPAAAAPARGAASGHAMPAPTTATATSQHPAKPPTPAATGPVYRPASTAIAPVTPAATGPVYRPASTAIAPQPIPPGQPGQPNKPGTKTTSPAGGGVTPGVNVPPPPLGRPKPGAAAANDPSEKH